MYIPMQIHLYGASIQAQRSVARLRSRRLARDSQFHISVSFEREDFSGIIALISAKIDIYDGYKSCHEGRCSWERRLGVHLIDGL